MSTESQSEGTLKVAYEQEPVLFQNRHDAGRQLAGLLRDERINDAVVVGLARGGVVVAAEIARALELPLDALAVRKVGYPWQPEYALGAVTPGGGIYLRSAEGLSEEEIDYVVGETQAKAEELDRRLHERRAAVDIAGKYCILVDDGLATGSTMLAAVRWARAQRASKVIVAVPVGARETLSKLEAEVDRLICLEAPELFLAVGMWYRDFGQVTDDEVIALLEPEAAVHDIRQPVTIEVDAVRLPGDLVVPTDAQGVVAFAHGSGSSRFSPRNRFVANVLNAASIGTLLFDLLTPEEELDRANVFDIDLLGERLVAATRWLREQPETQGLPCGYFGASTGAAAALVAAAELGEEVRAVVSRGGRPDLAEPRLGEVKAPTLLIVGGADHVVIGLNQSAAEQLGCEKELAIVPEATHLFEEPGALERVAEVAADWFLRHLSTDGPPA